MQKFPSFALLLLCLFSLQSAADVNFGNRLGVRIEAIWHFGDVSDQDERWKSSFALATVGELYRNARPRMMTSQTWAAPEPIGVAELVMEEYRAPFVFEYVVDSRGESRSMFHGVHVSSRLSPVFSAAGEARTWVANPWVWVGAIAVGAAASGGGGGGSGGSGSSDGASGSSDASVIGSEDCRIVDASDGPNDVTVIGGECLE